MRSVPIPKTKVCWCAVSRALPCIGYMLRNSGCCYPIRFGGAGSPGLYTDNFTDLRRNLPTTARARYLQPGLLLIRAPFACGK
jgi:hypothetical protein